MSRCVTNDANLSIFQMKILNNVLQLNEKGSEFKLFLHLFVLFVVQKIKPLYNLFTLAIIQNLLNSEVLLPHPEIQENQV